MCPTDLRGLACAMASLGWSFMAAAAPGGTVCWWLIVPGLRGSPAPTALPGVVLAGNSKTTFEIQVEEATPL